MRNGLGASGLLILTALFACDARVDENYRGETLLQIKGSLLIEGGELPNDPVPALAFEGATDVSLHILDVDALGQFPANFTLSVMSPPPAAAMRTHPTLPSYAVGYITAIAADHPDVFDLPEAVDGVGSFTCAGPDDPECFRRLDLCIEGTDECYHELARCVPMPVDNMPGVTQHVCNEIIEQSGDPTIAFPYSGFAGLSEDYYVVYADSAAPAGAARGYLDGNDVPDPTMAFIFGDKAIAAGYHLIRVSERNGDEGPAFSDCIDSIASAHIAQFNADHGTSYMYPADVSAQLQASGKDPDDDPTFQALTSAVTRALFDAGCYSSYQYEHVDPGSTSIEIVLGKREAFPMK